MGRHVEHPLLPASLALVADCEERRRRADENMVAAIGYCLARGASRRQLREAGATDKQIAAARAQEGDEA